MRHKNTKQQTSTTKLEKGRTGTVIAGSPRKFPAIWYRTSAAEIKGDQVILLKKKSNVYDYLVHTSIYVI